jgi:hypothetical protein
MKTRSVVPLTSPLIGVALALGACGDGRHFARDDETVTETEPAGPARSPGSGTGSRAAASQGLEVVDVWGEGLDLEISGLRWGEAGEIELLLGAVDPEARRPVEGLDGRSFRFAEDGRDLGSEVLFDVSKEQNLRVALVLDLSRSMVDAEAVEPLQTAARGLLDALPNGTRVGLVQFATEFDLVRDFTSDLSLVAADIEGLAPAPDRAGRFTNLWGALGYAGTLFEDATDAVEGEGRVVVAFTDGRDNVAASDADTARAALAEVGALVYAVGLGTELDRDELAGLTGETRFAETTEPRALGPIFDDIGRRLGQLMRLRYVTPKAHGAHTLSVTLEAPEGRRRGGFTVAFDLD